MAYGLKHNGWESSQRLASGSAPLPPCFSSAAHGAVGSDPICLSRHWGIDLLGKGTFQEVIPALEWFPIRQQPYVEVTKIMKICLQSWNSAFIQIIFPLVGSQSIPIHMMPSSWRNSGREKLWCFQILWKQNLVNMLLMQTRDTNCFRSKMVLFPKGHKWPIGHAKCREGIIGWVIPHHVEALTPSTSECDRFWRWDL